MTADYHDFVIRDGKFIGRFEEMYRAVEDPWYCLRDADSVQNDLLLTLVGSPSDRVETAVDAGCGLGGLTGRLVEKRPTARWFGVDISGTAVEAGRERVPAAEFVVADLAKEGLDPILLPEVDLVVMSQLVWYILPTLDMVLASVHRKLRTGGHLILSQALLAEEDQQYGKGMVETVGDLKSALSRNRFRIEKEIQIDPRDQVGRPEVCLLWGVAT